MNLTDEHRVRGSVTDYIGLVALMSALATFLFAFIFQISISTTSRPQKRCFPDCIQASTPKAPDWAVGTGKRALADANGFQNRF